MVGREGVRTTSGWRWVAAFDVSDTIVLVTAELPIETVVSLCRVVADRHHLEISHALTRIEDHRWRISYDFPSSNNAAVVSRTQRGRNSAWASRLTVDTITVWLMRHQSEVRDGSASEIERSWLPNVRKDLGEGWNDLVTSHNNTLCFLRNDRLCDRNESVRANKLDAPTNVVRVRGSS